MINKLKKEIEKNLELFLDEVKVDYKLNLINPSLYKNIREFCLRKGKRIRPLLLILSYKGYRNKTKRNMPSLYKASICIELLHNFMLIHDDIIDNSDLRRGKPTLHKLLGNTIKTSNKEKLGYDLGIIAGDIVYAFAIDAFTSIKESYERKEKALKYFVQTAAFTAMGEFIDTINGVDTLDNVKEKDVFLNYTLKTSRYTFDCPLVIGAILAGANKNEIKKLSEIGLLTGQAFQIQDDIIGIFDSEKNIGKSILSDLAESKKTILVCHSYKELKGANKKELIRIFNKKKKTFKDLKVIRELFIKAGSLQYSLNEIQLRYNKSVKLLKSLKMDAKYRDVIKNDVLSLFKQSNRIAHEYNIDIKIDNF